LLGVWLAAIFLRLAYRFLSSQLPHAGEAVVDWRVLVFIVAMSAGVGMVSGVWPTLATDLRTGWDGRLAPRGRGHGPMPRTTAKARMVLVMAQVGGAMALLSLTIMLVAHMHAVAEMKVGFRTDHLVNFAWGRPGLSWSDVESLQKNLEAIPGVESVAFTQNTPLAGDFEKKFMLSGGSLPGTETERDAYFNSVSSNYFSVLAIPLLSGRFFSKLEEQPGAYPTVVVNEAFAQRFSPVQSILGRRICAINEDGTPCEWREIIGVAGDVRDSGIFDPPDPAFYLPGRQSSRPSGTNVCVRTRVAPEAILADVRKAVSRTSPDGHAFFLDTVEGIMQKEVSTGKVILFGAWVAAAATLLLAAGGLYGTLFNIVRHSRRETGIRMALGATPATTIWHFVKNAGKWVGLGVALGAFGAVALNQSAEAAVYGLPSLKPWVLAASGALVILVSFVAVFFPLREAAHLNPAEVLRHE
jgi:predicted permease